MAWQWRGIAWACCRCRCSHFVWCCKSAISFVMVICFCTLVDSHVQLPPGSHGTAARFGAWGPWGDGCWGCLWPGLFWSMGDVRPIPAKSGRGRVGQCPGAMDVAACLPWPWTLKAAELQSYSTLQAAELQAAKGKPCPVFRALIDLRLESRVASCRVLDRVRPRDTRQLSLPFVLSFFLSLVSPVTTRAPA